MISWSKNLLALCSNDLLARLILNSEIHLPRKQMSVSRSDWSTDGYMKYIDCIEYIEQMLWLKNKLYFPHRHPNLRLTVAQTVAQTRVRSKIDTRARFNLTYILQPTLNFRLFPVVSMLVSCLFIYCTYLPRDLGLDTVSYGLVWMAEAALRNP